MENLQIKIADTNEYFTDLQFLHKKIWGIQDIDVTPTHIYSAVHKNGGVMLCAYIDNEPVAFSFGFYGKDEDDRYYFYSHNMGVLKEYRHQGIGLLLKLELARQLLRKNVNLVKWTFDPLESANAYLNIHKLQATSDTYITNYHETTWSRDRLLGIHDMVESVGNAGVQVSEQLFSSTDENKLDISYFELRKNADRLSADEINGILAKISPRYSCRHVNPLTGQPINQAQRNNFSTPVEAQKSTPPFDNQAAENQTPPPINGQNSPLQ